MARGLLSPRFILFCSLIILAVFSKQSHAWGRIRIRTPRISAPRISLPRIRTPRISLPRIRTPRISLPRIRIPRISLPKIRLIRIRLQKSCFIYPTVWPWCKDEPKSETTTKQPYDPCSVIVSRRDWQAPSLPPSPALDLPMYTVAVYVSGKNCADFAQCKQQASELYTESRNYNFLIGGDRSVFEGRGWDSFSDHYRKYGLVEYGVSFMAESLTEETLEFITPLLECGLITGKIYVNFTSNDLVVR